MALFGNQGSNQPASSLPIDKVQTMRAQGYDNYQIIQALQKEGFSSSQIFDAMNQAQLSGDAPAGGQGPGAGGAPPATPGGKDASAGGPTGTPPGGLNGGGVVPPLSMGEGGATNEEYIEQLVEEKWNSLVKDVNAIIEWKNKTEEEVVGLKQQFEDLKGEFDKLHAALIGKIGEYDKNILNVGAEVKAMEKVFQKVLPQFTDNVNELTRATDILSKQSKQRN